MTSSEFILRLPNPSPYQTTTHHTINPSPYPVGLHRGCNILKLNILKLKAEKIFTGVSLHTITTNSPNYTLSSDSSQCDLKCTNHRMSPHSCIPHLLMPPPLCSPPHDHTWNSRMRRWMLPAGRRSESSHSCRTWCAAKWRRRSRHTPATPQFATGKAC
jgi:hypothetical protein